MKGLRLLIFHYRVGRTDGVSLEITAWKEILESKGVEVKLCSGVYGKGADYKVKHFENQLDPAIYTLDEEAFGGFKKYKRKYFENKYKRIQNYLEKEFEKVIKKAKPDRIVLSNIFSVGENLPAAGALTKALDKYQIPTMFVGHDFYWENGRYKRPSCKLVKEELEEYFPPKRGYIKYFTINSIAKEKLYLKKGIKAKLMPDTLDFEKKVEVTPLYKRLLKKSGVLRGDIVVLQATRIIRRKNIEIAVDYCAALQKKLRKLQYPVRLYDGRLFDPAINKVVFLVPGYSEKRDKKYNKIVTTYARKQKVNLIALNGEFHKRGNGQLSLLKMYTLADVVTYPSVYEGFGNQFLEAVFSKKPVVEFEYPVFKKDIKPKGFKTVSLGDKVSYKKDGLAHIRNSVMEAACVKSISILTDENTYLRMVNMNFFLGARYYSYTNTYEIFKNELFSIDTKQVAIHATL